jgi:hypothetical protein
VPGFLSKIQSLLKKDPVKDLGRIVASNDPWLGPDQLAQLAQLRREGKLDEAEAILLKGEQTPAVVEELRKVASARAKAAKKAGDWAAVIRVLEGYKTLLQSWRQENNGGGSSAVVDLTTTDEKLLAEAYGHVYPQP